MKNRKGSRLYRIGSALLAAAMVFTCMPQTGLNVYAEEGEKAETLEQTETKPDETEIISTAPSASKDTENSSNENEKLDDVKQDGDEEKKTGTEVDNDSADDSQKDDLDQEEADQTNKIEDSAQPDDSEKDGQNDEEEPQPEGEGDDGVTDDLDGEEDEETVEPENTKTTEVSGNDLGEIVEEEPIANLGEMPPAEEFKEFSLFQVNPFYEDILDADELRKETEQLQQEASSHQSLYTAGETTEKFDSIDEASAYLRGQMVDRANTVAFALPISLLPSTDEEKEALLHEFVNKAILHTATCSGREGDALALGYKSWKAAYSNSSDSTNFNITYTLLYYTDYAQETSLTAKVNEVISSLNLGGVSEYQKIRKIYDYICDHVDYDHSYTKYSAYDALCTGTAVCQGYSILFYRLCKEAGLSVRCITGLGYGGNSSKGENHAWNIVRLGDKYYNVDSTWDGQDTETRHNYFLLNENDFVKHERAEQFATTDFHKEYPMATASYIDESEFTESYKKDNLDFTFPAIEGGTISTTAAGKPKLLIFFNPDDGDSQSTVKSIAGSGLTGSDIYAIASAASGTTISEATVKNFKNTYGGENITFAYDADGNNISKVGQYVKQVTGENSLLYPVICYIDANNKFQYLTQGISNASWVKANLQHYCNAVFAAEDEYTITYELDGGTNDASNPSGFKASVLPITLKDPSKAGYHFEGWYTDSSFADTSKITSIVAGTTNDITLYAKWKLTDYAIKSPAKTVYLVGETLDLTGGEIINKDDGIKVADIKEAMTKGFASDKEGNPTVTVTYNGATLSFDVLVIGAPTGLTMYLDQPLSDVTLPSHLEGAWEWQDSSAKPDAEGEKGYKLTFKPKDLTKYTTRTDIPVKVTVTKRNVIIDGVTVVSKTNYDGKAHGYAGTPVLRDQNTKSAITEGVTIQASYTGTCADKTSYNDTIAPVNAGSYTLSFTLGGTNANLYNLQGNSPYSFEIAPSEITIAANSHTITVEDEVPEPSYISFGLVSGDKLTTEPTTFTYQPTLPTPLAAGTYKITPAGADAGPNYTIKYVDGNLVVNEADVTDDRETLTITFDTISVKDKTYSGEKHSVIGYPLWSKHEMNLSCVCRVSGKTDEGDDFEETKSVSLPYATIDTEFAKVYEEIAPAKCGKYTFEISVQVDESKYNYSGSGFKQSFYILPLHKNETKLSGVTGITGKIYDGTPVDFSKQILAAKVQTNQGVNLDDAVLEFGIKGKTAGSEAEDYHETISPLNPTQGMPKEAGSYTLWVKLIGTKNYLANEWEFPFEIKQKALTVTVDDKTVPVHADGSLLGGYTYVITDADDNILSNDDFGVPVIAPMGDVDTTKTGEYVLAASGDIADPSYDVIFVDGTLLIQAQLWGVKELKPTQNTNIPNGTSLSEIAQKYLPKTATVYLDKEHAITDTATVQWDTEKPYAGSYSEKNPSAQAFQMKGTVVLPDLVYVEDSHKDWLTVVVDVSVREAYSDGQALMPYADVPSGIVSEGTKVSLFTDEPDPGAQIYYTIAAENPSQSSTKRLYTGPIEIKCTMTIRAVTHVTGKKDSEEIRIVYYFDQNYKPDDPDNPDDPDVPDEDIPKDEDGNKLPIPDGLWVTDIAKYTYTGKAIKPTVRVYDHKKRLEEKKDYTVSYKNNVNAADKGSAKAPTVTITGKGNYEGKLQKTFTIAPKNINDVDVKADSITVAFNNKQQTPAPTVTWNGKKLKNKKEYSFEASPQMAVGSYPVTLHGIGNYTGDRRIDFVISNAKPAAKLTVSKLPSYTYTGKEIEPEPVVKSGKEILRNKVDYTLSYEDNTEIGTASVLITGAGRFAGVKRVTFQIKEAAVLNKAEVELVFGTPTIYTGKEITASDYRVTVQATVDGVKQSRTLVKDTDYKVTYQNNVKAGKATAVFEGIGAYRGTLKKTFTISAYELPLDRNKLLNIQTEESYPYMKGGSTPDPVITFDGKTLKKGTDYTVSYKNNKAAGSPATMTIKGKGNFTGSVARGFTVATQNLDRMSVEPADRVFRAKANNHKTTIRVYDTNGKKLTAGKDYEKTVIYTYVNDTTLSNGTVRKADDEVTGTDIIPAGTKLRVQVTAKGANYVGTALGEYAIVQSDLSKAKVTVPSQTYTGKAIELEEKDIMVLVNGVVVSSKEYKIIGYSNNVNKGTAKLTIRGQGNYGGTKTVSFQIKGKSLFSQIFG